MAACSGSVVSGHPVSPAPVTVTTGSNGTGTVPDFTQGVVLGSGAVTVAAYDDLGCPPCARLERTFAPVIDAERATGRVTFHLFDLSFLDTQFGTNRYSSRAANELLCAAQIDPVSYLRLKDVLLADQPAEGSAGRTDDQLLASAAGVGLTSADFATCVRTTRFAAEVSAIQHTATRDKIEDVPYVTVNGAEVTDPTGARIKAAIDAAK